MLLVGGLLLPLWHVISHTYERKYVSQLVLKSVESLKSAHTLTKKYGR